MSRIPGWTNVSSLVLRFALFAGVALYAQLAGPAWAAGVHYVRADATGANNGHLWADAYTDLQAALAAAVSGEEIWVAKGTYKPTTGTLRTVSFVLKEGVGLYGGFAGTETERDQRDWKANATILSGDIRKAGDTEDNSYCVVIGADFAVLDGFTITAARDVSGMYNKDCSPIVTNCTFSRNSARGSHGYGGGMYNLGGSPTVSNCTFSRNTAGSQGGGMHNSGGSPTIANCTFSGNTAGSYQGGGMYNLGGSPTVINSTFSDNGDGGMYNLGGSPTVTNCTFSDNDVGGMSNDASLPTVTNCTFSGNIGGGMNSSSSSPTVTNCLFSGNSGWNGGGMYNHKSSATVTNCMFSSNEAVLDGGGMYNSGGSPTVTNCTFSRNNGGDSDYFKGRGGGMYSSSSSPTVTNCIFWNNDAHSAKEVCREDGTPTFVHCDIKGSGGSGAGWKSSLGKDGGGNIMADPRFADPATPVGPDGLWRTLDDGLRLQSDSPCIGAADPAAAPRKDILGLPRKIGPDLGAYEFLTSEYCTLTYNAGAGGSISGTTPVAVAYGADGPEVTAVPNTGYRFVRWSDGSTDNPRTDTNVTAAINVRAIFSAHAAVKDWSLYE